MSGEIQRGIINSAKSAILAAGLVIAPKLHETIQDHHIVDADRRIKPIVYHLQDRYGVGLEFSLSEQDNALGLYGWEVSPAEKIRMAGIVQDELGKLPPPLVRKSNLQRIVVAKGLSNDKYGLQPVLGPGLAATNGESMYLYTLSGISDWALGWQENSMFRRSVAHELHHLSDISDGIDSDDAQWADINPNGEADYFNGDNEASAAWQRNNIGRMLLHIQSPHEGFASFYARTQVGEDQAEVAAMLFAQDAVVGRMIYDHMQNPVLSEKLANMKGKYLEWSGGLMDEQYWDDLRGGMVDENYWDEREGSR